MNQRVEGHASHHASGGIPQPVGHPGMREFMEGQREKENRKRYNDVLQIKH